VNYKIQIIKEEFAEISYSLDERRVRLWCVAKANTYNRIYNRGGVTIVHKATGISRSKTIGVRKINIARKAG